MRDGTSSGERAHDTRWGTKGRCIKGGEGGRRSSRQQRWTVSTQRNVPRNDVASLLSVGRVTVAIRKLG